MKYDAAEFLASLFCPSERHSGGDPVVPARVLTLADLPDDLRAECEERAGIMEYDGELPRAEAERLALTAVRAGWCER
jgi:hypothetical protein